MGQALGDVSTRCFSNKRDNGAAYRWELILLIFVCVPGHARAGCLHFGKPLATIAFSAASVT